VAIAERLEAQGREPPKALRNRPRLRAEQQYLAGQFMFLHRTRAQGFSGLAPITLEACQAFLEFWPQYDKLLFVEIMIAADQELIGLVNEDNQPEDPPGK
jgi:hypothetical protein